MTEPLPPTREELQAQIDAIDAAEAAVEAEPETVEDRLTALENLCTENFAVLANVIQFNRNR